ncbi:metal ABC transporter solute-binding protein, Zn/Mn family, partial [Enterobacter cloacae]|uniref:metal ABC transporter solute-binding protein, Zn/Mn family n=1 Tax=Enterobacter cloacae TaxID=550 RepID=UPI0020054DA3
TGGTADRNRSHWSTSKTPSYTKSVSWQHHRVTFIAPQGLSSESEASAAQVAEIINQIKADGVKTWFMENQLDPRLVKQIATATGAQPGGELYPEALSAKGGVADTYVKAFRHNVNTLARSMK